MRVRTKLITITVFVAVVPLAFSAYQSLSIHRQAMTDTLLRLHANTSQYGASTVDHYFENTRTSLRTMVRDTIDWEKLSEKETAGALWLIHGQFEEAQVAQMQHGNTLSAAYLPEHSETQPQRQLFSSEALDAFQAAVPTGTVEGNVGPLFNHGRGTRLLPVSIVDQSGSRTITLGLNVQALCARLARLRPIHGHVELFNSQQQRICSTRHQSLDAPVQPSFLETLRGKETAYDRVSYSQINVRGFLTKTRAGWSITVEQPLSVITAPTTHLQRQSWLWVVVGAATALASGLILSRSIHRPLERLTEGAESIGNGTFGVDLDESSSDELGKLSKAFNKMSREVARRDWEIHLWTEQLERRVAERGRQLERAHQALSRSRKMAGLSTLTAGIAHEMNNPLTGILGLTQILHARLSKAEDQQANAAMLQSVVQESQRMQRLLEKMMTLNEPANDDDFQAVSLEPLLAGLTLAEDEALRTRGAQLDVQVMNSNQEVLGNPKLLNQLFQALLQNALRAVPERGGHISIRTSVKDGEWICVTIEDNGHGIKPELLGRVREPFFTTKANGQGEGLGLARAHQIVELHNGTLDIRSEWQVKTEVEVTLPMASTGAHLV